MKNVLLVLLAFFCLPGWSVNDEKEETTKIELAGELASHNERSLIFPIEAYENNLKLSLFVLDTMENVTLTIYNGITVVYSQTSTLLRDNWEIVSLNNYPNGIYTLVITTPQGTYLTGVFEINR